MIDKDTPRIDGKEWHHFRTKSEKDPNFFINEAPIDGLLAMLYSGVASNNIGIVKLEFLKTLLRG